MKFQEVVPGVYQVPLGIVNAFIIDEDGLTLIDSGTPGSESAIFDGVRALGKQPRDIRAILLTHLHGDHVGSAKALQQASGAKVYMHPLDSAEYLAGRVMRAVRPAPGWLNRVMVGAMMKFQKPVAASPAIVDEELFDGQELEFAGGLKVIHTPGHTAGHVSLFYPKRGGVLMVGDACGAMFGLGASPLYEDYEEGLRSLKKLSALSFETACLAHGKPLRGGAAKRFREKWS